MCQWCGTELNCHRSPFLKHLRVKWIRYLVPMAYTLKSIRTLLELEVSRCLRLLSLAAERSSSFLKLTAMGLQVVADSFSVIFKLILILVTVTMLHGPRATMVVIEGPILAPRVTVPRTLLPSRLRRFSACPWIALSQQP